MEEKIIFRESYHRLWEYCSFDSPKYIDETADHLIAGVKAMGTNIQEHFRHEFKVDIFENKKYLTDDFFKSLRMPSYDRPYKDLHGNIDFETVSYYCEPEEMKRICALQVRTGLMECECSHQNWINWNKEVLLYEFNHFSLATKISNVFYHIEIMLLNSTEWKCYTYYSDKEAIRGEGWFVLMVACVFNLIKFHNPKINEDVFFEHIL